MTRPDAGDVRSPQAETNASERLESWKAIANYFGRTVRTVQRWERHEGLPVRRHRHSDGASAYAYVTELDAWRSVRSTGFDGAVAVPADARAQYVRGQYFLSLRTKPSLIAAIREFKQALRGEPAWVDPYLGIATAYLALSANEFWSPEDGYPRARAAAEQALEVMPDLAAARTVIAFVGAFYDSAWKESLRQLDRAIQLQPELAEARYFRGVVLMNLGDFDAAIEELTRASQRAPLSAAILANIGRPSLCAGDYQRASEWFRRAVELEPDFWIPHLFLGWCLDAQQRYDEALVSLEQARKLSDNISGCLASTARCLAAAGDRQGATEILEELQTNADRSYISPVRIARVCVALGEIDDAFVWLDRGSTDHSIRNNMYLPYDYAFAPVRNDPRFVRLLRDRLFL
jgi:tetratricopeptide (TPR) repeat protein